MKTHIMIGLIALMVAACASKRDIASTSNQDDKTQEISQHAQMIDAAASERGSSVR